MTARAGYRHGRFSIGAIGEFHSSGGYQTKVADEQTATDAFRILVVGSEIGYSTEKIEFKAFYKTVFNSTTATLSELGDVMDHGAGGNMLGSSLALRF